MGSRIQRHYLFGLTDGGGTVPPDRSPGSCSHC
ncbi:hypothetical protein HNR70_002470 [Brachybacterium aquaticum]|uniref:Uncharacterized protein n=1 Tax=Brachybacterium aquaticum TaxID=1432564 RepID=A0A841AFE1_9MICO|nr:hypothetical protein [Brachybacterium aquaticum]